MASGSETAPSSWRLPAASFPGRSPWELSILGVGFEIISHVCMSA